MSLLSTASSFRGFKLVVLAGASAMALLMSACSSTKDEQFAASAPQQGAPGGAPYAVPTQAYPYPNQTYAYPNQGYPNQTYPNQAYPNQPFAASSWAQPGYGQSYAPPGAAPAPYGYVQQPQPAAAPEKESYRDEYMRKRNQQK